MPQSSPRHVVLATLGTDGDVFPYVGLGATLRKRGKRVTLVASEHYQRLAEQHDLEFRALHSKAENDELFTHPDFWHPIKTARLGAAWGLKRIRGHYDLLRDICAEESSVIVANPGILGALLAHEKHGTPWASIILQPWMIPSAEAPSVMLGLPIPRKGPVVVRRLYWRFFDVVVDLLVARGFNAIRASLQLPPVKRVFRLWLSPQAIIGAFPSWYAEPQSDWPKQVRLTGFPMFDGSKGELPADLLKFCRAGSPPIALTFGSEMMHAARLFNESIAACQMTGSRCVVLTKYRNQLPEALPAGAFHCAFARFEKLFPLCSAIVHHGGVGTMAQALAAGTPQLILPIAYDQGDNGERVKQMGAGDWIYSKRATAANIATALSSLSRNGARDSLQSIKGRFTGHDGLSKMADVVETLAPCPA